MSKHLLKAFLCLSGLALSTPSIAQDKTLEEYDQPQNSIENALAKRVLASDDKNFVTLAYENDLIGGGTDQYYTSGVRASWFNINTPVPRGVDKIADAIPTFDLNDTTSTFFTIGQNIFTPQDIEIRANQDDDRPWAGFLYGSVGLATLENNHIDELELTLGIVGPESLGEQTQKAIHKHITNSPAPQGWDNQLKLEPGIIFSAQRRWPRAFTQSLAGFNFRAEPNVNISLGNIYTYAGTGLMFAISPDSERFQDTPGRVRPSMPGSGYFEKPEDGVSWLLFASVDGRIIGRNIFLDGNTFKDSHSVDKKYTVGDATVGAALTFDRYRLSYSYNARTEEFKGQDGMSTYGALTLSAKF